MGSISKFEDLIAWQKARALTNEIYAISRKGEFAKDFGLKGQMQRSAVSVMSNIAEGFERRSTAEYLQFLNIAKASCAELRSQLYVSLDVGYISNAEFDKLLRQTQETGRVLGGLMNALKNRQ